MCVPFNILRLSLDTGSAMSASTFKNMARVSLLCIVLTLSLAAMPAYALEKATIQLKWHHHFQFAGYYAALEKGFYKDAGLDVTIREGGPSVEVESEVSSGRADFGVGTSALLLHKLHGEDFVVVGQIFQHSSAILLTPRKTGIRSVADIAGRKVMYSNQHGDILALLKKNGIEEKNIISVPHNGDARDLIDGKADVMVAYSINEPYILERAGEPYLTFSPLASGFDFYGDNFFATRTMVEDKPELVKAFREATLRGWRYALSNKAEIADVIIAKYSKEKSRDWLLFEANQAETLIQPDLVELGYQNPDRWKRISEIFSSLGMLPAQFDPTYILYAPEHPNHYKTLVVTVLIFVCITGLLMALVFSFRRLNRRLFAEVQERKQAEDALKQKERHLQTIIDASPECIKLIARDGTLLMMNKSGLDMIEADSAEQAQGQCVFGLIIDKYRKDFINLTAEVFRGDSGTLEFEATGLHGRVIWLETHAVPLRDDHNEIFALLGITRDVTAHKVAEQALRYSENFLRESQQVGKLGSYDFNIQKNKWTNTETFDDIFGITESFSRDYNGWISLIHPDYREQMNLYMEQQVIGLKQSFDKEYPIIRQKDGELRWVHGLGKLHVDDDGIPINMIGTIQDITERRQMEEERMRLEQQVLRSQKLESLGILAGGIAHDFNNILTGILGNISFAKGLLDESHRSSRILHEAEKAAHRATGLTHQLLTFAKGSQPIKKVVAARQIVDASTNLVLSGSNVKCTINMPDNLYDVEVDEGQLGQAFNNIILNAVQAMQDGGSIIITAENITIDGTNTMALNTGDYVKFSFTDKGSGISEENMKKIFDPYFTTKVGGNGLGLASVYSIINKHGGHIGVRSMLDVGTTFDIILPASLQRSIPLQTKAVRPAPLSPIAASILIMDDEVLIRDLTSAMLSELGYQVQTCINGEEAIRFYKDAKTSGHPYSAVIMDLTIPGGMGGKEAAQQILKLDPSARLIVSSGYSTDPIMADHTKYGFKTVMTKPYSMSDISHTLSDLLSATS